MAEQGNGHIDKLNNDGSFHSLLATVPGGATGLATDPGTGFLYVSTLGSNEIIKINPTNGTQSVFIFRSMDGIAISSDGKTLYGEEGGSIRGYSLATGLNTFDSGGIGSVDGAALGLGTLSGKLIGNTNDGRVVEVDLATNIQTVIATGGSRGDLVSVDPSNGSLLLSQSDSIIRLGAPPGATFGPTATPEPATWAAGILGAIALVALRRRSARASA